MSYRYMRLLLFFDLPRTDALEMKIATSFQKALVKSGFIMLQESVYCKLALNMTGIELIKSKIKRIMPKKGSVIMLTITERQFENMDICCGEIKTCVADSDSRLLIL